jgi:hypothetical protein
MRRNRSCASLVGAAWREHVAANTYTENGEKSMPNVSGYSGYDGLGLAELISKGEVTPDELLEDALAGIAAVNPQVNGVVADVSDLARAEIAAGLPQGPFTGVPFFPLR